MTCLAVPAGTPTPTADARVAATKVGGAVLPACMLTSRKRLDGLAEGSSWTGHSDAPRILMLIVFYAIPVPGQRSRWAARRIREAHAIGNWTLRYRGPRIAHPASSLSSGDHLKLRHLSATT